MKRTLALALLLAGRIAAAEEAVLTIEASGQAPLAGDAAAAREAAKADALRACVQQVAAGMATAAADADQAQLLSDRIYARAVAYVRRFQVLDDREDAGGWSTRLRCEVARGKLEDDLLASGIAHRRPGLPRVVALLAEQPLQAPRATGGWEAGADAPRAAERAFTERMERCGFAVVPAAAVARSAAARGMGAEPSPLEAQALARELGAEVVVVARLVARPLAATAPGEGALPSAAASVSARVVRADGGAVLAALDLGTVPVRSSELAAAGRGALSEAGRLLARELFVRVGRVWATERSGVHRIAMGVTGVADYARLAAFKAVLVGQVRGVKDVTERSIEGGRAELDVGLAGTTESLATDLATRKLGGFTLKVRSVSADALEVELF